MTDIVGLSEEAVGQLLAKARHNVHHPAPQAVAGDQCVLSLQAVGLTVILERNEQRLKVGCDGASIELQVVDNIHRRVGAGEGQRYPGQLSLFIELAKQLGLGASRQGAGNRALDDVVAGPIEGARG
ncbi:hypothetical protein ACK8HJ_12585 [Vreelandella titanicae]|uniref:hypothetical protein n=1 Tax=Vreelandella titanicae TaxID=664683 RepID=UPI00137626D2|nr:hypothetical protein [Halomonas titanicae]NVE92363.1 hypothetical protein [Halomonas titanicae]